MRLVAPKMSQHLGQPVVIENRPGATGVIASEQVARAAPDGYTIVMGSIASHSSIVPLNKSLPYDAVADFTHIGGATATPAIVVVSNSVPARDLKEFVAWARTQSRGVDYASGGTGSSAHLAAELVRIRTGTNMVHIPYKETGRMLADLMAGTVKFMIYYASVVPLIHSGQLKALAVMSQRRLPSLPDVATTGEQGFENMTVSAWNALMGPAKLPDGIRDRIYEALYAAVTDPSIQPNLQAQALEAMPMPSAEFRRFLEADIAKWTEVVRVAGIKMD
ncbi:MAG: Bug family tripartite tricarboxylate transporter substrate binding protein [Lautropia sp.]